MEQLTKLISLSIILTGLAGVTDQAMAWSRHGHEIVADIAEANFTPEAKREVSRLLALEGKSHLHEVSSWADYIRGVTLPRQPMHSVRIPLDAASYDQSRDCADNNCILAAIANNLQDLKDPGSTDDTRLVVLKYLTHFIGDLHQPLHTSKDTGQRKVIFNWQEKTLHAVWDENIPECPGTKFDLTARNLLTGEPGPSGGINVVDWALDSRNIARDRIFPPLSANQDIPIVLPSNYCEVNWPIARSLLKYAGVRLAWLINEAVVR